jgi:hypothetical protein
MSHEFRPPHFLNDESPKNAAPSGTGSWSMSHLEAIHFLRTAVPANQEWVCWLMDPDPVERVLSGLAGVGFQHQGQVDAYWKWERVPCEYPAVGYWTGNTGQVKFGYLWSGLLRVQGQGGEDFLIFSYLRKDDHIGKEYLVSSGDFEMLRRFAKALQDTFAPPAADEVMIDVVNGQDIYLPAAEEPIYLPARLQADIEQQVFSFFRNAELYRTLKVPYRRGLLFTGHPGTGKTLLLRNLVRRCYKEFKAIAHTLVTTPRTGAEVLQHLFSYGQRDKPCLLIIEDLESLARECAITRSALLAELDGLAPRSGALIIATANRPELIDSALLNRPSRFDRIWRFPLPNLKLRRRYLAESFPTFTAEFIQHLARKTENWTFAYIKELHISAAIMAAHAGLSGFTQAQAAEALALLAAQFKAASKQFLDDKQPNESLGFSAGEEEDDVDGFVSPTGAALHA